VADLWDSLVEDEDADELKEEIFKGRMTSLLNETAIHLTSVKVAELRREIERMFCSARVLTDIRTAFGYDAKKRPALTIMHTLEIKYHDDTGKLREFYVAVDDDDLTILKEAINRAFEKKATLVDLLEKSEFDLY
jgi:ribosomal protein L17